MTKSPDSISTSHTAATALSLKQWLIGLFGSWGIVWLLGPLILNSILVRVVDTDLDIITHRPNTVVRWRSEGHGTTLIGPHGLPGWQPRNEDLNPHLVSGTISPAHDIPRIVIWGDSQVEGFCVADSDKIHNQTIQIAAAESQSQKGADSLRRGQKTNGNDSFPKGQSPLPIGPQYQIALDCLPMGRSGSDARDWIEVMPRAERLWQPDLHVWILTDLSDLTIAVSASQGDPGSRWTMASPKWIRYAAAVRAQSLFAAAKRIFYDPSTDSRRRLDFSLGPRNLAVPMPLVRPTEKLALSDPTADLAAQMIMRLNEEYDHRLTVLYAPGTPRLMDGLVTEHPDDELWNEIHHRLRSQGIGVVDLRSAFINLWQTQTKVPRGFHNGMPSYGHLNPSGNRLVATGVIQLWKESLSRQQ